MKYIRTENGIYEVENDVEYAYKNDKENHLLQTYKDVYEEYGKETNWTDLGEIIEIADTIEELIDAYILKDTETGYCGIMDKETMKHSINPGTAYGREFYGAIWIMVENGIPTLKLKSVAKMNRKGELELL